MRLSGLELFGFKSFYERTKISFNSGITAIVGPNGSGKSNITDAIRWVLGEQNAKNLRGSKMEDLIFAGTEKRKPINFAEVTISIDNSDGKLPFDYNEISVLRKMHRSGESSYYINGSLCRLRDIHSLFLDSGIGKGGYSIISQGRIEQIISNRPEDRRIYFEEAAGILKHKLRKEEALRKLAYTEKNIVRLRDIVFEVEHQTEILSEKAAQAKKYQELSSSAAEYEKELLLYAHKQQLDRLLRQRGRFEAAKLKEQEFLAEKEEVAEQIRLFELLKEETNQQFIETDERIASLSVEQARLHGEYEVQREKLSGIERELLNIGEHNADAGKLGNLLDRIAEEKVALEAIATSMEDLEQKFTHETTILTELNQRIDASELELESLKNELFASMSQELQLGNEKRAIEDKISELKSNSAIQEKRKNELQSSINEIESKIRERKNSLKELDNALEQDKSELACQNTSLNSSHDELRRKRAFASEVGQKKELVEGRIAMLQGFESSYEGYNSAVKFVLGELRNRLDSLGICGSVIELFEVKREHIKAIDAALKASAQNIVIEQEKNIPLIINALRKSGLGRVSLMPLDVIKGATPRAGRDSFQNFPGYVGLAVDLIDYEDIYREIFLHLLGRILIVDKHENALVLARASKYSQRIVTLDGEIVNRGGVFTTGNYGENHKAGLLERKGALKDLHEQGILLETQLIETGNELLRIEETIAKIVNSKTAIEETQARHLLESQNLKAELSSLMQQLDYNQKDYDFIDIEKESLASSIGELANKLMEIEKNMSLASAENEAMKTKIEALTKSNRDTKDEHVRRQALVNDLGAKINNGGVMQSGKINRIAELEAEIGFWQKKEQDSQARQAELNDQKKIVMNRLKNIEGQLVLIKEKLSMENILKNEHADKIAKINLDLKNMNEKLQQYYKNIVNNEGNLRDAEIKIAKAETEIEILAPNLPGGAGAIDSKISSQNEQAAYDATLEEIKQRILELGQIDIGSILEYELVLSRLQELRCEIVELSAAKENLANMIQEIEKTINEEFVSTFDRISNYFKENFSILFNGGEAELRIVELDDELGIDIIASPPGKKLQSLNLLSGGEKALSAIALLFAFLQEKPSPFVVLDEIEAALDEANIDTFTNFIKNFSDEIQFVIVTHQKKTMEIADTLHGVTMIEKGVSKLISVRVQDSIETLQAG
jgi:chromosome segregation protein